MATPNKEDKRVAFEGFPDEEFAKYVEQQGLDSFRYKILRRNESGHLHFVTTMQLRAHEVSETESILRTQHGGGRYHIYVYHPQNTIQRLFDFNLFIDGPRVTRPTAASSVAMPAPGGSDQPQSVFDVIDRPTYSPFASHTPDEIALRQLEKTEREKNSLQTQLDALMQRLDEQDKRHRDERERERIEQDKRERERIEQEHKRELAALKEMMQNRQPTKSPIEALMSAAPVISALAPIATALITTRKDMTATEATQQQKMHEMQMKMFETLAGKNGDGTKNIVEMLKVFGPLLAPVLNTMVNANGPKAQAELLAAQSDANMAAIQMMAQLLESAKAEDPGHPALQLAERVLEGIFGVASAITKARSEPTMAQEVLRTAAGTLQQVAGQPADPQLAGPAPSNGHAQPTFGENVANQVFQHPMYPTVMKTQEWHMLLADIHDKAKVEDVAQSLANHIFNLDAQNQLPKLLETVWDNPEETFTQILSFLPIWQLDKTYAQALIARTIEIMSQPNETTQAVGASVDEDEDEETEATSVQ